VSDDRAIRAAKLALVRSKCNLVNLFILYFTKPRAKMLSFQAIRQFSFNAVTPLAMDYGLLHMAGQWRKNLFESQIPVPRSQTTREVYHGTRRLAHP
jgi:hypothetical protein